MSRVRSPAVYKAIVSRRSIRQFRQRPLAGAILRKLINAARLAPSAANLQPLEFIIIIDKDIGAKIFPCLKWAGYISPYGTPQPGKRPVAYIAVLVNEHRARPEYADYDVGAAAENILLAARGEGIGSCWLQAINRDKIKKILSISGDYRLDSIICLGYPAESPTIEQCKGSVKYWKDKAGTLHVPKRSVNQVIRAVI